MSVIQVDHLTKLYGKTCALEDAMCTFEENKIYGLLGRNGAGKTTLLNLISNRIFPTAGTITVDGAPVLENDAALRKVFFMTEQNLYPENMRVKECFRWTKEFYPDFDSTYAENLCRKFELNPKKKMSALSTGYQSIAKMIIAMASQAPVTIFDEPVLGLDAHHRDLFYKELLANYMENPKTIILSTHIIEEISTLLENVVILKNRKVIVQDSVENLLKTAYCAVGSQEGVEKFIQGKTCVNREQMASYCSAAILGECTPQDKAFAAQLGVEIIGIELQKLFIHLTNEEAVQ